MLLFLGLNGNIHVTIPWMNLDFDQRLWLYEEKKCRSLSYICTNVRTPEDCVIIAMYVSWPEMAKQKFHRGQWATKRRYDAHNADDIDWLTRESVARARRLNISGALLGDFGQAYLFTLGVVERRTRAIASTNAIISAVVERRTRAIASTNAIISAMCAQEAFKLVSHSSRVLDNFALIMGTEGMGMPCEKLQKDGFQVDIVAWLISLST